MTLREIGLAAFPEYRGRKFRLSIRDTYDMEDYWSEGTRRYVKAATVDETGKVVVRDHVAFGSPMADRRNHVTVEIPPDVMLVEHAIFCGHDTGITVYVATRKAKAIANAVGGPLLDRACPARLGAEGEGR